MIPAGGCVREAGMGKLPMNGHGNGSIILSVVLELELNDHCEEHQRQLGQIGAWLVELTRQHRLPATWEVADPAQSAASEGILAAGVGHELAVLAERTWIGHGSGRARLARELARRFEGARRLGIPVSTLALRNIEQPPDPDLLLDQGITAVHSPATHSLDLARQSNPPTRYGIWQAPTAWRLPIEGRWWTSRRRMIRQALQRCSRQQGLLHLEVDVPSLIRAGIPGLRVVEATLRMIAAGASAGQLEVRTTAQIAADVLNCREGQPTRSILRPAA